MTTQHAAPPPAAPPLAPEVLTTPGTFLIGCNYWASHAGTAMWSTWRPDVIEADFRQLSEAGVQVLRVFPLWPDFQPLQVLPPWGEVRHGEDVFPDDDAGRAGVSPEAMERFRVLADLAQQHGLQLVVGLVTGWMSGRLFVPRPFEHCNVLTDATAIMWQVRFVKHFVRRFKGHPAVLAWDLGNECNVMGAVSPQGMSREQAWVWTSAIAGAIRSEDTTRPVVSGMHSLKAGPHDTWHLEDQGELTDVLTSHPYPVFTPHCDQDPLNTMRTILHSTAESRYYGDLGGRPCLVEEIGSINPMVASDAVVAQFVRAAAFSAWAHDCHGLFWWCGYDQAHLSHAPYDWYAGERELGLFQEDRTSKPVRAELSRFGRFLRELPVPALPPRLTEAVCLLSEDQDHWGVAYGSFVLAKQAGFDLEFQHVSRPLKPSRLYLLPCITGLRVLPRRRWLDLLDRVRAGATLFISHHSGLLSPCTEPLGFEVLARERRPGTESVTYEGLCGKPTLPHGGPFRLTVAPARAEVLGRAADGNPIFLTAAYGAGRISFLSVPLEQEFITTPGACHLPGAPPYWRIYQHVARPHLQERVVAKTSPLVGLTEHPLGPDARVVVLLNYSPRPLQESVSLAPGWRLAETWYGAPPAPGESGLVCAPEATDAVVIVVARS